MSLILMCTVLATLLAGEPAAALPFGGLAAAPSATSSVFRGPSAAFSAVRGQGGSDDPGHELSGSATKFGWPLPGSPAVVRAFQAPAHDFGPGHRGVDLAGVNGTPVLAAGAGTVVFAGQVAGRGVVSVDHPGGLRTTYEPVSPTVAAGDLVARGQQIGTLAPGHPDCAAVACLHWGARRGADYLDPLRLLGLGRVRLLPWEGISTGG
ncbi:MAG: M23 family metallopeptidase [Pseudonocardiales bacterium]